MRFKEVRIYLTVVMDKITTWRDIQSGVKSALGDCKTLDSGRCFWRRSDGVTMARWRWSLGGFQVPSNVLSEKDVCHEPDKGQFLTTAIGLMKLNSYKKINIAKRPRYKTRYYSTRSVFDTCLARSELQIYSTRTLCIK